MKYQKSVDYIPPTQYYASADNHPLTPTQIVTPRPNRPTSTDPDESQVGGAEESTREKRLLADEGSAKRACYDWEDAEKARRTDGVCFCTNCNVFMGWTNPRQLCKLQIVYGCVTCVEDGIWHVYESVEEARSGDASPVFVKTVDVCDLKEL